MTDHTQLIGMRVMASKQASRGRHSGVLLPAAQDGGLLRLHSDGGRVYRLTPELWLIAPETPTATQRADRRRTRCPDGRPLYRFGDLPADQLATKTMLKLARRKLAEGQQPIASYMTYGRSHYAPLYAIADAVPRTPLTPAQQEAYDRARVCARCGERRKRPTDPPYPKGADGQRYCDPCQEPAAQATFESTRQAGRERAVQWARAVLSDPAVVLLVCPEAWPHYPLRAETLAGEVLIDFEAVRREPIPDWWLAEERARITHPSLIVNEVQALQGRRLITWRTGQLGALLRDLKTVGAEDIELSVAEGDQAGPHWDEHLGERNRHGSEHYRFNQLVHMQQPPSWQAAELINHIRTVIAVMGAPR